MENVVQMFNFQDNEVNVIEKDGDIWFKAKDVCDAVGIKNSSTALNGTKRKDKNGNEYISGGLDNDEKATYALHTQFGDKDTSFVSEPGLYHLLNNSSRPEAKPFQRWVNHEVLPSIRKTGGYVDNDDLFINTYLPFADDSTKLLFRSTLTLVKKQNEQITEMKPKAEVHDQLVASGNYATMNEVAKNIGIGRNKMFEFLRAVGVCFLDGGNNIPKQSYQNEGYFKVTVNPKQMGDYIKNVYTTRVSGKGNVYLLNLVNTYGGANKLNNMKQNELRDYAAKKHGELKKQRKHGAVKVENPDFKKKETVLS